MRKALNSPVPPERKTPARSSPRLDPFKAAIDAMLVEDTTPGALAGMKVPDDDNARQAFDG